MSKRPKQILNTLMIYLVLISLTACSNPSTIQVSHIHGLSYNKDGSQLLMASHHGLFSYDQKKWGKPEGQTIDLMGFTSTENAVYSSGHPGGDSDLPNPVGIIKSSDQGKTWKPLAFHGESDFHLMTAGYRTSALYVANEHPNSKLQTGIYVTEDEGQTWKPLTLRGITGNIITMAAHPTQTNTFSLATTQGLFLSHDQGSTFKAILGNQGITAIYFDILNPQNAWVASYQTKPVFMKVDLRTSKATPIDLPILDQDDQILSIAQNPTDSNQLAFATMKNHVYITSDQGKNWHQIIKDGQSIQN